MKLQHVPLLAVQRDIYRIPRGPDRFRAYLDHMLDPATGDLRLPLTVMNPMAKDQVLRHVELLLAMGAEESAAQAVRDVEPKVAAEPGTYRLGLIVADDMGGGWTHRAAAELSHLRGELALEKRGWITPVLWASDTYGPAEIREEVFVSVFRAAWVLQRGAPQTLRDILLQEGTAMRLAGARNPALEPHALVRTREVIARHLDREDQGTLIAALFGDRAARELGHEPLGLPERAGLALALHGRLEPRPRRPSRGDSSHRPSS